MAEAKFDSSGRVREAEFDWLKRGNRGILTWENTILGSLKISGRLLKAEVNSENRAKRLRSEIEKRLGSSATHLSTVSKSMDEMLAHGRKSRRRNTGKKLNDEFLRVPEIRKELQERMQKQAEAWISQKIPALSGRTPMEAVQDPDGREIVESLLLGWERRHEKSTDSLDFHPDIGAVRRLLNLSPRVSEGGH